VKIKRRRGKPCIVDYEAIDNGEDSLVIEKVVYKCGCEAAGDLVASHCPIHGDQIEDGLNSLKRVIADYIDDKGTVDLAEIVEQLQIPPKLVMDICDELSNEGKIV